MNVNFEDKLAFGRRLEEFIKSRNVTQDEVAVQTKLTRQTVNNIINGKSNASSEFLIKMASIYRELNLNWLISGKGEMVNNGDSTTLYDPREDYSLKGLIELLDEKENTLIALQKVISSKEQTLAAQNEIIKMQKRIIDTCN